MSNTTQHDRTAFIGGSDVAAILGVSPWKSAFRLYQEKIGEFVEEVTPAKQKLFNRGHRWEPVVVEMLLDELRDRGHDAQIVGRNARYQDPEFPFLACELDLELLIDGEETNAEMKTVSPFAAREWGEQDTDEIPLHYAAQGMHGLMIKPRRRCVFGALIGADDLRVHQIERDDETIAAIRAKELEFWRRVQERDAPDPETADDVKWLFPRDTGIVMEADSELLELCEALRKIRLAIKSDEASENVLATRIKVMLGHASTLIHNGQTIATWKSNKDSVKTDWKMAFELLQKDTGASADQILNVIRATTKTIHDNRPLLIK